MTSKFFHDYCDVICRPFEASCAGTVAAIASVVDTVAVSTMLLLVAIVVLAAAAWCWRRMAVTCELTQISFLWMAWSNVG